MGQSGAVMLLGVTLIAAVGSGCSIGRQVVALPAENSLIREQLVVHSDFHLPQQHRLLDEVVALRGDVAGQLLLPTSDEPIHVYLFESGEAYSAFMQQRYPALPQRRAFFVENDTELRVYAHWGERIAEDLRHEISHGYLHAVVPNLPLWLDEGLAEYFEVPRGHHGVNKPHVELLLRLYRSQEWTPKLERLEAISRAEQMTQLDYAEAWLWVHWMLETTAERRQSLQHQLARLRIAGVAEPLSQMIASGNNSYETTLFQHLQKLAGENE